MLVIAKAVRITLQLVSKRLQLYFHAFDLGLTSKIAYLIGLVRKTTKQ